MADLEQEQGGAVAERDELTPEERARRDRALSIIRKLGDPALRSVALPVTRFDRYLRNEAERMARIMEDAQGIGLAATQLGVMHRLLVYRADPEGEVQALANPEIVWRSDEQEAATEGCLSIPGVQVEVERPTAIKVRAQDLKGREVEVEAEGLEARVIQHEVDHLDGILILDRIDVEQRREAMRSLRKERVAAVEGG